MSSSDYTYSVIPLPLELKKYGSDYTQLKRGQKTVMYSLSTNNKVIGYEVFKIRIKPFTKYSKGELREWFPSAIHFGHWAWSPMSLERAILRFNTLENEKGS